MKNLVWRIPHLKEEFKVQIKSIMNNRGEFGIGTVLSIATAIIVAAFVLIPGVRDFAAKILTSMSTWWGGSDGTGGISGSLFKTS